jgi:opacity protein-like surface antigen
MRSVKVLIAAGAASLLSSGAFAADMAIASPPPAYYPPPIEDFGGWYLRGDIGMTNTRGKFFAPAYDDVSTLSVNQLGHGFTGGTSYAVGVGYQFNSWFRADVTGEYRSKVLFSGTDFANIAGLGPISDVYSARFSSWVAMANVYVDLGTWWCITPFVGAGVGYAYHRMYGFSDSGYASINGAVFPVAVNLIDEHKTSGLAWSLQAGLAYEVTQNVKLELSYRYINFGDVKSGLIRCGTLSGCGTVAPGFTVKNLDAQEIRVGMRWLLDAKSYAEAPAPIIRKY